MFLNQVRHFTSVNNDPEVESYIQSLGDKLVSYSDSNEQLFTFFVVNDPSINAFAGPGGMIGMNSGVILNSSNESELAAVMAHEITHVTQRHLARQFEEASKYSLLNTAALIGALLIGISNPDAGMAAMTGAAGLAAQNSANFTRANEQEADRIGMQVLAKAGYDPRGMPAFFEKLQPRSLIRVRAVLDVRKPSVFEHGFHTYYDAAPYDGLKTAILFMNNNDGYIKFEDGTKIDCVYNRLVVFPANMPYTTTSCSDQPQSIFIEVNYF